MDILGILGLILGSSGVGALISQLYHAKTDKKFKEAETAVEQKRAEGLANANEKDKFDAMYVQITKMMQDYNDLSDDYRKYRQTALDKERVFQNKVNDKCQELAMLKSQVQYLKGLRCYNTTCPHRIKTNPEKQK